jgi:thiamine pyrophosphate-dependent acetolactate synthase large subunit-like protein
LRGQRAQPHAGRVETALVITAATERIELSPAHAGGNYATDGDIHPLRLCEEIKNFMQREAILTVDGQEILNYGRQSIPTFVPGHRLNSGPFGTMGVGLPFAVGAKAAKPSA